MRDLFANYDAWLERPYQEMMWEDDQFVDWAENEGYDLDNPEDVKKAEQDYETYLEDCAEAKAEAHYEAYQERLEMEAEEREYEDWNYSDL